MKAGISRSGREELAAVTSRGKRLVTVDDVVDGLALDRSEAAKKLARWTEQGWLRRVRRGLYIPVPVDVEQPDLWSEDPLVLAHAVWSPCYFTGWTAANHWGLTEQIFRTTVVKTSRRVRATHQRLLDHDYLIGHTPDSTMAWGVRPVWRREQRVSMADESRTVVDVLDDPGIGGGIRHVAEILSAYLIDFEGDQLLDYGERLGNRTAFKRMGYLIEAMGLPHDDLLAACRERISGGVSLLDPEASDTGPRIGEWGLRANVRLEGNVSV
jgi:predicted transcriptional regulator of viral defense system